MPSSEILEFHRGMWDAALRSPRVSLLPTVNFLGSIVRIKLLLDRVVYQVVRTLDQAHDFLRYLPPL